jgi:hypothetical protein
VRTVAPDAPALDATTSPTLRARSLFSAHTLAIDATAIDATTSAALLHTLVV